MHWSIILSGASLLCCGFFFLYFRAYLRRRTGPEQLLADIREEVYKLIAEIDAATDKDALLVEERIKTLRGLLEDVDKRISVHIREIDRRRFQEEAYAELGRKRSVISALPQNMPKASELFSPKPVPPEDPENQEPPAAPRIVVPPEQIQPKPLPMREQVLELSRAGLSPSLIALRLGLSLTEVETAIAISEDL